MNTTGDESKETLSNKSLQFLDEAKQEGTSTSNTMETFDASQCSNQASSTMSEGYPNFLAEEPSSLPPPPRKKSGATLITLPADETRLSIPKSPTSSSKTHARTNTFGTIHNEMSGLGSTCQRQPRAIKEAETASTRRTQE